MTQVAASLAILLSLAVAGSACAEQQTADLLVSMNSGGTVERYDGEGKHVGTFARALERPNGIAAGPDGNLYIATGAIGGPGTVTRVDGRSGRSLGPFIAVPGGQPGALQRATSMVWNDDNLFVVSCDSGEVLRYDARTGAFRGKAGRGSKGGLTQLAFLNGLLYVADSEQGGIRRFDVANGKDAGFAVQREGFFPWGVTFDEAGRLYWSGNANEVRRFDGTIDTVMIAAPHVQTPVQLAMGPDGLLYVANLSANSVAVVDPASGKMVRTISGPEVLGPIGLAFTTGPRPDREEPLVLESSTRDKGGPLVADAPPVPANASPVVRITGDAIVPQLPFLGVDTERGDRVKHNLLRAPISLALRTQDGTRVATGALPCVVERGDGVMRYRITFAPDAAIVWEIATAHGQWRMKVSREGTAMTQFTGVDVVLPLNPRICATSIVVGQWSEAGHFALPAILSAPDLGQFHVTVQGGQGVEGSFVGQRGIFVGGDRPYWMDITFHLPMPDEHGTSLNFTPLVLPSPPNVDPQLWRQARRGWFNLFQLSSRWERPGGARGAPPGLIANNVLSDPVSSLLWFHGDQALLLPELAPGVLATDVLRHTVEFWLYDAIEPDGQVWYVAAESYQMMDANPAVLIAAWCYIEATGDLEWAKRHLPRLELLAGYFARRDLDLDGLCESVQSGNAGGNKFPGDTSIDTISSGHKNAWVNALVFRAWRCLSDIEQKLDRADEGQRYRALSDKLRAAYAPAFLNPGTGLLIWWRSADGEVHDYASVVAAAYAVEYGLLDEAQSRALLEALWKKIDAVGYRRFDIGLPINLEPVPPNEQCNPGGTNGDGKSDPFEHYCNGGVFPQFAINVMTALWRIGRNDRADQIFQAMLERQDKGVFPNGGGFQCGITDKMGTGPEVYDWNGQTTGYEGHCVRDCSFVMGVLLRDPAVRAKVYRPVQEEGLSSAKP